MAPLCTRGSELDSAQRSPRAAENMVGIEGDNAEHYTLSETGSAMDEAGYQLHHDLYQANGSDLQARPTVPYDVVGTDKTEHPLYIGIHHYLEQD